MRSLGKPLSQIDIYEAGQDQQIIIQSLWRLIKELPRNWEALFQQNLQKVGKKSGRLGLPPFSHSPVLQDCFSSRGAVPTCSSSLGWKSYSRRLQQRMSVRSRFPSNVRQEAYERLAAIGWYLFPYPRLLLHREDLSGIVGEASSLLCSYRMYYRRADPAGLAAKWQLPSPPASKDRRLTLWTHAASEHQQIPTSPALGCRGSTLGGTAAGWQHRFYTHTQNSQSSFHRGKRQPVKNEFHIPPPQLLRKSCLGEGPSKLRKRQPLSLPRGPTSLGLHCGIIYAPGRWKVK